MPALKMLRASCLAKPNRLDLLKGSCQVLRQWRDLSHFLCQGEDIFGIENLFVVFK